MKRAVAVPTRAWIVTEIVSVLTGPAPAVGWQSAPVVLFHTPAPHDDDCNVTVAPESTGAKLRPPMLNVEPPLAAALGTCK